MIKKVDVFRKPDNRETMCAPREKKRRLWKVNTFGAYHCLTGLPSKRLSGGEDLSPIPSVHPKCTIPSGSNAPKQPSVITSNLCRHIKHQKYKPSISKQEGVDALSHNRRRTRETERGRARLQRATLCWSLVAINVEIYNIRKASFNTF